MSKPINRAKCNSCDLCVKACLVGAVSGQERDVTKDRDDFFKPELCREQARLQAAKIAIEATICGKCIQVCPYTQRYLKGIY